MILITVCIKSTSLKPSKYFFSACTNKNHVSSDSHTEQLPWSVQHPGLSMTFIPPSQQGDRLHSILGQRWNIQANLLYSQIFRTTTTCYHPSCFSWRRHFPLRATSEPDPIVEAASEPPRQCRRSSRSDPHPQRAMLPLMSGRSTSGALRSRSLAISSTRPWACIRTIRLLRPPSPTNTSISISKLVISVIYILLG